MQQQQQVFEPQPFPPPSPQTSPPPSPQTSPPIQQYLPPPPPTQQYLPPSTQQYLPPPTQTPLSPEITNILTKLKEVETNLEELKEEKSESTGGSSMEDDILGIKNNTNTINKEFSEYIKGGNTKKINLR